MLVFAFKMIARERKERGEDGALGRRWIEGIWVGRKWDANENVVLTELGVCHPRSVRRLSTDRRWDPAMVQGITMQSWGDHEQDDEAPPIFQEPDPDQREQLIRDEQDPGIREFYMRREDFLKHGHTEGCPKCSHMLNHPTRAGGPPHSTRCRERIRAELKKTPVGRRRLEENEARHTRLTILCMQRRNPISSEQPAAGGAVRAQRAEAGASGGR